MEQPEPKITQKGDNLEELAKKTDKVGGKKYFTKKEDKETLVHLLKILVKRL